MRSAPFADRSEAGRLLAAAVAELALERPVIYALPRGGVPVALEIAAALGAPLDLILVRKIGVPSQPELAAGAMVDGDPPVIIWNDDVLRALALARGELVSVIERERAVIAQRRELYLQGRAPISPAGRTAVLVDDGVATGASMRAAIAALRARAPARIVVAAPCGARETVATLYREADDVVCLRAPERFGAVGLFFDDFRQLSDDDVMRLMNSAPQ